MVYVGVVHDGRVEVDVPTGLTGALVRLRAAYSRMFGVCAICAVGVEGPPVTHWVDHPELGRFGYCDGHL